MNAKLITTVHWNVPDQFKQHVDETGNFHFLVFGGGRKRLEGLKDAWLLEHCTPDDYNADDNISELNPYLNEMTSIYTVWKNPELLGKDIDAIGHAHYRRFFSLDDVKDIERCDGIIAAPVSLGVAGFGCTLEKQYELCHVKEDFDILKQTIEEEGLMDSEVWDKWTKLNYLYAPCNLFLLRRECFNRYCADVFNVALKLPDRIDVAGRDDYQRRACSFLCERFTSYWFFRQSFRGWMKLKEQSCQFHPEWKATNSTDSRGCFNGKYVADKSLDAINVWLSQIHNARQPNFFKPPVDQKGVFRGET
jgi:hypothetical protein